jgi:hypothetical protein
MARRSGREARKQLAARMKRRLTAGWTADKARALATDVILERLLAPGTPTQRHLNGAANASFADSVRISAAIHLADPERARANQFDADSRSCNDGKLPVK